MLKKQAFSNTKFLSTLFNVINPYLCLAFVNKTGYFWKVLKKIILIPAMWCLMRFPEDSGKEL